MQYHDILDILMQRAARLGLVDAETGKADATELELYLYQALMDASEIHDLEAYIVNNPQIAVTYDGQVQYPMPPDYARLIAPRVNNKRGIYISDGVRSADLEYVDPNAFGRVVAVLNAMPVLFTVTRRQLYVAPAPDGNNGHNYTIRGIYIERITRPDLDAEVLLPYPSVLADLALFRLAGDMGKLTDALVAERSEGFAKLAGGPVGIVKRIAGLAVHAKAQEAQT